MDFIVTVEGININFSDISIDPARLNSITTILSKKLYQMFNSLIQTNSTMSSNNNNNLHVPILWVYPTDVSEKMSDEEISDVLSISVVDAIKKRI